MTTTAEDAGPRTGPQGTSDLVHNLSLAGALTTGVKAVPGTVWVAPFNLNLIRAFAWVGTAPTGAALILNIQRNLQADASTAQVYTTAANRPTVAISAATSWARSAAFVAPPAPDTTAILAGDILQLNIVQIGSTVAGSDLVMAVHYERA